MCCVVLLTKNVDQELSTELIGPSHLKNLGILRTYFVPVVDEHDVLILYRGQKKDARVYAGLANTNILVVGNNNHVSVDYDVAHEAALLCDRRSILFISAAATSLKASPMNFSGQLRILP